MSQVVGEMAEKMREIGQFADPKFWLRVKTAIKTSVIVILFSLLMFIDGFLKGEHKNNNTLFIINQCIYMIHTETPTIAIILGACYLTIIVHASVVGSIRNATEAVKGGFIGFIVAYISF